MSTETPSRPDSHADIDGVYHPALRRGSGVPTMPAGKVLVVVVVALAVAGLLNSAWMVRTAQGMREGWSRTAVLGIATGFDAVASHLSLDRPRAGLDVLLGHEQPGGGDELLSGDDSILAAPARVPLVGEKVAPQDGAAPAKAAVLSRPSASSPLRVMVLGDSLATYVGQQLDEQTATTGLATVRTIWRDGTGLSTPSFFNWQSFAVQQVRTYHPQAVVFVLGGNDLQDMRRNGKAYRAGTPEWQTEYARRVAVVMKAMTDAGVQRVLWSGPPTSRSAADTRSFRDLNDAVARAAKVIPGAVFVDLFAGTAVEGAYADTVTIGGQRVDSRQSDGLHWTWRGAAQPAALVLAALQREWGPIA